MSRTTSWNIVADSDIGDRKEQQDRFLIKQSKDLNHHLLAIADGAGGHKSGAIAAQVAIDYVDNNTVSLWSSNDPETLLHKLFFECNERVQAVGKGELSCTTLAVVVIKGDEVYWAHLGDTRVYLVRDGKTLLRTTDHSVIELQRQQKARGERSEIDASPNELYMCLGALPDIEPETESSIVRDNDALLICSDGLWNQININPLLAQLCQDSLQAESAQQWTQKAKHAHSRNSDNITWIAAQFTRHPQTWFSKLVARFNVF